MRQYLVLALLATITLAGCGSRGSLTLPPTPTPLATTAQPDPAAESVDSSTPPQTTEKPAR